jgi:hypothetical protein
MCCLKAVSELHITLESHPQATPPPIPFSQRFQETESGKSVCTLVRNEEGKYRELALKGF